MIVTKEQIASVLSAKKTVLTVDATQVVDVGNVVPLQRSTQHRASAYVVVLEARPVADPEGEWEVTVKRQGQPDRGRLLAADSSRGYTSNPARALRGEPEAVPEEYQAIVTSEATLAADHRWKKLERVLDRMTFDQRLFGCKRMAHTKRIQINRQLRDIAKDRDPVRASKTLRRLEERVYRA